MSEREMRKNIKTKSIYELVLMIREESSRNAKIEMVKNAIEHRRGFADFLKAVYDPFTQYYIRKIPNYIPENTVFTDLEHILIRPDKYLNMFSERRRTGGEAEKFLIYMLEAVPADDAKALEMIIQRDIDAGVNVKSINKACPGLIREYPCMLATAFKEHMVDKIQFPAMVQTKMDGLRANILVNKNGTTDVRGRSGKSLGLAGLYDLSVSKQPFSYVLDGEIIVWDKKDNQYLSRKKSNGIIRKYAQDTIKDHDRKRYLPVMIVWDYIPAELFYDHKSESANRKFNAEYTTRLNMAESVIQDNSQLIRMITTYEVNSYDEIREIFMRHLEEGEEGVIVKEPTSLWRDGRPKDHIKMKGVKECELFIKGLQEGKGRLRGKLGAFLCESSDGLLEVSVGSGFSDPQREEYFNEDYVGRVVSINFNEVIEHDTKNGPEKSLFLPIFVEVRDDKDTANSLDEIIKL